MAGIPNPLAIAIWMIVACLLLAAAASFLEGKAAIVSLITMGVVIAAVEYWTSGTRRDD